MTYNENDLTRLANPHPSAKDPVSITLTQEELWVVRYALEEAGSERGEIREFDYINDVANRLVEWLPEPVVTYANMTTD